MTHICSSSHAGCLLVRASLRPSLPPSLLPAEGNLIYQVKVVPLRAQGSGAAAAAVGKCASAVAARTTYARQLPMCSMPHSPTAGMATRSINAGKCILAHARM